MTRLAEDAAPTACRRPISRAGGAVGSPLTLSTGVAALSTSRDQRRSGDPCRPDGFRRPFATDRYRTCPLKGSRAFIERLRVADQRVAECRARVDGVVPTDKLLVVDDIALCEEHVAQMARGFKDEPAGAHGIDFEGASLKVEL